MRGKKVDLIGQCFGRLTVIAAAEGRRTSSGVESMWLCRCECGAEVIKRSRMLLRGRLLSCGCLKSPHGHNRRNQRTRTYGVWVNMRTRCENEKCDDYQSYGGRGITVCERWQRFKNFLADMGECPPDKSIERRDNEGDYEPSNCYWACAVEQANNKRRTAYVTFLGQQWPVYRLAAQFGLPGNILYARIFRYGWPVEEAVNTPLMRKGGRRLQKPAGS